MSKLANSDADRAVGRITTRADSEAKTVVRRNLSGANPLGRSAIQVVDINAAVGGVFKIGASESDLRARDGGGDIIGGGSGVDDVEGAAVVEVDIAAGVSLFLPDDVGARNLGVDVFAIVLGELAGAAAAAVVEENICTGTRATLPHNIGARNLGREVIYGVIRQPSSRGTVVEINFIIIAIVGSPSDIGAGNLGRKGII